MFSIRSLARKVTTALGISTLAVTGALVPMTAHAAGATVIDYTSTARGDYSYLAGSSTVDWAPWPLNDPLNASTLGADNWNGDADWGTHNFKVMNGALWVQKAQAGCDNAGIRVASLADGNSVISSTNNTVTVKVWAADAGVKLTAVATDINDGNAITANATSGAANEFSTVTFTFSGVADISYTKLWIRPDSDLAAAGSVHDDWGCGTFSATVSKLYKFDDLTYTVSSASVTPPREATSTVLTFESGDAYGATVLTDGGFFGGSSVAITDAPAGGLGGKALAYTKAGEPWAGINLLRNPSSTLKFTDATHKVVSMNFYSPKNGDVPVVLELNPGALQVQVTAHKGWQTLTFDFGTKDTWSAGVDYTTVAFFADFQVAPSATPDVYYVDNVSFNGASAPAIVLNPTVTAATPTSTSSIAVAKTLSFTVRDAAGAVVPNATVAFSKNTGSLSATSGVTNAQGVVTVNASNTAAGTQSVIAAYSDGQGGTGSATATITWSVPTPVITVTNSKRVITVGVTNGKNKKMTVTITGKPAASKTLTVWTRVLTNYTVSKAGKYTVKVVVPGAATVTKVFTIK